MGPMPSCLPQNSVKAQKDTQSTNPKTSGYATWFTARGAIRIAHYDVIDDVITGKL